LPINNLACSVKLYEIDAFHAQLANASSEFEDDCIVANKLAVIGKILQNANRAAQVQHYRPLALFWPPEDRRAEENLIGEGLRQSVRILLTDKFVHFASPSGCMVIITQHLPGVRAEQVQHM
jgi:hypothetical protein